MSKEYPFTCPCPLPASSAARPAAAAAADVPDKAVTGVDEAAVAAFLANFKKNWGSGAVRAYGTRGSGCCVRCALMLMPAPPCQRVVAKGFHGILKSRWRIGLQKVVVELPPPYQHQCALSPVNPPQELCVPR